MGELALLLLAPLFAIMAWLYWIFPKSFPRTRGRRRFDVAALVLSTLTAVILAQYGYLSTVNLPHQGRIGAWQMAAPVLYAYTGFSVVFFLAIWVRKSVWGRAAD